jgi:hypothetical protein
LVVDTDSIFPRRRQSPTASLGPGSSELGAGPRPMDFRCLLLLLRFFPKPCGDGWWWRIPEDSACCGPMDLNVISSFFRGLCASRLVVQLGFVPTWVYLYLYWILYCILNLIQVCSIKKKSLPSDLHHPNSPSAAASAPSQLRFPALPFAPLLTPPPRALHLPPLPPGALHLRPLPPGAR